MKKVWGWLKKASGWVKSGAGSVIGSKYLEIVLAVGLFILLDTGVLILNFYTSYQIANDAHAIKLSSVMGTLNQEVFQRLYQVRDDAFDPEADYLETVDQLARPYKTFDETLDAFIYGGSLIGEGQGQDALLKDTTYRDTSAHLLKDAETIWQEFRKYMKPVVYAYFSDASREEVIGAANKAIAYARVHNEEILNLMDEFAHGVEGVAQRKAQRLRRVQGVGITLAVINFFIILFHFIRRLSRTDNMLEEAQKQNEDILKNVDEGLFLLDPNYIIGSQHSKRLYELFQETEFENREFLSLMKPLVTEKTLESVTDYLDILFSPHVNESLVADLNPLTQVEIHIATDSADFHIRYFRFQFSRVQGKKGKFSYLLVTVKDISDLVKMGEELKAAGEKAAREMDMLLGIMHVDGHTLKGFLDESLESLTKVNTILKKPVQDRAGLENKLHTIARIVHRIKGDSSTLGIGLIENKINGFENALSGLKQVDELTGEQFLPLVVQLNRLITDVTTIRSLQDRLQDGSFPLASVENETQASASVVHPAQKKQTQPESPEAAFRSRLNTLVNRVAADEGKTVELELEPFSADRLDSDQFAAIQDVVVQCLRNAVVHGIESPETRARFGKPAAGTIRVALREEDGSRVQLRIRDDGNGIDLSRIREKAVKTGIVSEAKIRSFSTNRLLSLMFAPGMSTAETAGTHAGQGVGLDLVRERINEQGGRVRVLSRKGDFTEFIFTFDNSQAYLAKTA